ncbi:MAG: gfo/Idh/MocA family oxidoreductase [Verrucomicrobiales bacterium]|nr:gfo/Idh/MocA family oxidoreductase [Verrucomicrobiales bacterium]
MNTSDNSSTNRRDFLKTSTLAVSGAIAAPFILGTKSNAASPGDTIKVGLIGCGGRGTGAALNALKADENAVLTAVGDLYEPQAQSQLKEFKRSKEYTERINVKDSDVYHGFDAYKGVIESGVDVVILATPPGFRPLHMKAAVAANKHMFVEKPMSTDVPGLRSIMESVEEAKKKKLAVCAGFCWRYNLAEQALFEKLHEGEIGDIRTIYATYNTGFLWDRTSPKDTTDLQKQLRNWMYYTWLSGDHYCEQAIHAVDWMCWAMKDIPPVKCIAHGGRQVRTDPKYGHIFDHFEVVYEYATGARGMIFARQQAGCANDNTAVFYGTKGTGRELGFNGMPFILDEKNQRKWTYKGPRPNMYDVEHEALFKSIRAGKPINNGDRMVSSTLTGIMGRMAAYTGKEITWDMAMNSQEKLVPDNVNWDTPAPEVKVAMPGQTQFM